MDGKFESFGSSLLQTLFKFQKDILQQFKMAIEIKQELLD